MPTKEPIILYVARFGAPALRENKMVETRTVCKKV